ncbi:MAG: entericidin A/B family lipoprotein [Deltaproteobacteria bacterium]|nr:entericidin A/B family lipoprotein [Deltaproteobacteria bacterium]
MKRKIAAVTAVALFVCMWLVSGCHTVKGVGEDIQKGGEAIERSSGK